MALNVLFRPVAGIRIYNSSISNCQDSRNTIPLSWGRSLKNRNEKLGLSCAQPRPASLISLLVLVKSELCKVTKKSWTYCEKAVKKSWKNSVQVVKKSWTSYGQDMKKSQTIHNLVMNKLWTITKQVMNKSWVRYKWLMDKWWRSYELVTET